MSRDSPVKILAAAFLRYVAHGRDTRATLARSFRARARELRMNDRVFSRLARLPYGAKGVMRRD